MTFFEALFPNTYVLLGLSACISFFLAAKIFPAIIFLSNTKNLMDVPGDRSMHVKKTPTLGGIGIYISFAVVLMLFGILIDLPQSDFSKLLSMLIGTTILLFLGVKDDLLVLSPRKKIIGQVFAASIAVILTDVRIRSFGGVLGIEELPVFFSILFTVFVFLFIINAYNLTDGIDGLAASIAIVASVAFGIYFIINANYMMGFASCGLIGSLLSFLRFNLSNKNKIFMGDSGSMFVGFILAFQSIVFLAMNGSGTCEFTFNHSQLIALAVFSFPILDTTRVFFIRIKSGQSPFSADRNHIHHRLVDLGLSHREATFIICNITIAIVASTLLIDIIPMNINLQLLLILIMVPSLYLFPFFMPRETGAIKLIRSIQTYFLSFFL